MGYQSLGEGKVTSAYNVAKMVAHKLQYLLGVSNSSAQAGTEPLNCS